MRGAGRRRCRPAEQGLGGGAGRVGIGEGRQGLRVEGSPILSLRGRAEGEDREGREADRTKGPAKGQGLTLQARE